MYVYISFYSAPANMRRAMGNGKAGTNSLPTNPLRNADEQHALGDDAVAIVEMQDAQPGAQAVETETRPRCQIVRESLVVHDFESVHHLSAEKTGRRKIGRCMFDSEVETESKVAPTRFRCDERISRTGSRIRCKGRWQWGFLCSMQLHVEPRIRSETADCKKQKTPIRPRSEKDQRVTTGREQRRQCSPCSLYHQHMSSDRGLYH
jgi:hypothetical protein